MTASALFAVNRESGLNKDESLGNLERAFHDSFRGIASTTFIPVKGHDSITEVTSRFLATQPGPWLVIAGGGGGTTRAATDALLRSDLPSAEIRLACLRLGSGNLVARRCGQSRDPLAAIAQTAAGFAAGRTAAAPVYRCDADGAIHHGLALGLFGVLAAVPTRVTEWNVRHARLRSAAAAAVGLERLNSAQYIAHGLMSIGFQRVEVRSHGSRDSVRLAAGVLLPNSAGNFELTLAGTPWRRLDLGADHQVHLSSSAGIRVAIDEDELQAVARVSLSAAGFIRLVLPGSTSGP